MKRSDYKVVGHLGFRKGSKGLLGKNEKFFFGKPLFQWSLDQLAGSEIINDFMVSTDSQNGYKISLDHGSKDIGIRDSSLSNDTASKFDVWRDSYNTFKDRYYDFEIMIDIDCTCPMRSLEDISNGYNTFIASRADLVLGITDAKKNPYFNLLEESSSGYLTVSKGDGVQFTRQGAPKVFEHVSSVYVIDTSIFKKYKKLYDANIKGFHIPYERSIDIDSEFDWKLNTFLMNEQ